MLNVNRIGTAERAVESNYTFDLKMLVIYIAL
jgi:hypothetical protein